jgi:hypothetical protein
VHRDDGSGAVGRVVQAFTVVDGTLRYRAGDTRTPLACTAGALRKALAALDALDPAGAVAFVAVVPVTDAVKRVAGGRVVGSVDRTPLRSLVGPARVPRDAIDALLAGPPPPPDDAVVRPLAAVTTPGP